jgi:hypothetical protein
MGKPLVQQRIPKSHNVLKPDNPTTQTSLSTLFGTKIVYDNEWKGDCTAHFALQAF